MLRDLAKKYYFDEEYNCAEALLLASNEMYNLGLKKEDVDFITAFGGGMGCGRVCGALSGSLSALGRMIHLEKDSFHDLCASLVEDFEKSLTNSECNILKEKYKTEEERCLKTVELAADVFENFIIKNSHLIDRR